MRPLGDPSVGYVSPLMRPLRTTQSPLAMFLPHSSPRATFTGAVCLILALAALVLLPLGRRR